MDYCLIPAMSIKKFLTNVFTFGASGRIEKRYEQYERVHSYAELKTAEFNKKRDKTLICLSNLAHSKLISAELLIALQKEYVQLKNDYPVLSGFTRGCLRGTKNLEVGFTAEKIAQSVIVGISKGILVGIDVAYTTAFVHHVLSAKATTGVMGSAKLSTLSNMAASKSLAVGLGYTKVGTIGTAGAMKMGGVGLAGKGALAATMPILLPFALLGMALFSHSEANKQIEKINAEENKLNVYIEEFDKKIIECKRISLKCGERQTDLDNLNELVIKSYQRFDQFIRETFRSLGWFKRVWLKVCLWFGLPNKNLATLRAQKKDLEGFVKRIHLVIKESIR